MRILGVTCFGLADLFDNKDIEINTRQDLNDPPRFITWTTWTSRPYQYVVKTTDRRGQIEAKTPDQRQGRDLLDLILME